MVRLRGLWRRVRVGLWVAALGVVGPGLAGCGSSSPTPAAGPAFRGVRVVVAAVGDPAVLTTVSAQRGEWEASRGASCEVLGKAVEPSATQGAHVLVFRGDRLGDLVDAGALAVLPESVVKPPARTGSEVEAEAEGGRAEEPAGAAGSEADALQFSDVLPAFRDQVCKYGSDRLAMPYGGSALVLVYNRAAFESEANRVAAKEAGVALEPPVTWRELDALAKFFQGREWSGDNSLDHGIALALGPDEEGVGDAVYLARATSLGQHRDHYSLLFDSDTMEPRLTTPPFVEALEGLVSLKVSGPPGVERFDAEAARQAFRKGNVAMLIDRAECASKWGGGGVKSIGVAPLPGSDRVYEPLRKTWETPKAPNLNQPTYLPFGGGWLVGVAATAGGRQRDASVDLVKYLVNPETSGRVRSDRDFPMLPVRSSQVGQGLPDPRQAPGVEPRAWIEAVSRTLIAPRVVPGLRIPKADGYLADLARGRVAAVNGRPAAEALRGVAEAWSARTKALGTERELWHYRRSLNSLVTTPTPPARPGG
jgi:multiple sugar transport system substrate-binding protein